MIHALSPAIHNNSLPVELPPTAILPTIFHIWKLSNCSLRQDICTLQLLAGIVSDTLELNFDLDEFGIFTRDQMSYIFTTILKVLEISVSQGGSPYTFYEEDLSSRQPQEKMKAVFEVSKIIIFSIAGDESLKPGGVMDSLECLINSIETFFHPSNSGAWTYTIVHLLDMLVQNFLYRWNSQKSGEYPLPEGRYITEAVKERFVVILRNAAFMSIHSKSSTAAVSALNALHGLAYLAPDLVLPLVLKEVYPSLQGVVETHRTMTSLKALSSLARVIAQSPRYAIHLSALLNLAIPGIDTNDLNKTFQSLSFIQAVALNVPFWDLSSEVGSGLAMQYISNDVAYLEELAVTNELGHDITSQANDDENEFRKPVTEMPVYEEELLIQIWQSSTYSFGEFVSHFLERVFTLIENLPDPSATKSRATQESNVVTILAPTFSAVMASLPPENYENVITHILDFITSNVYYSACDAIALICSNVIKDNPGLSFPRFFPVLKANIEQEIIENGAGSTRSGSEILPRDRTLIWYLGILNMSLAHAGIHILKFKQELLDLTMFLRDKCRGSIVYHISNTVHHALMSLSTITVLDAGIVPKRFSKTAGIDVTTKNWGEKLDPKNIELEWRVPCREEVAYCIELFEAHVDKSLNAIFSIISGISKGETVTEVSDSLSSNLTYLRTATSGISYLLDPQFKENHSAAFTISSTSNPINDQSDLSDADSRVEDEAMGFSESSDFQSEDEADEEEIEEIYPDGDVEVTPGEELEIDNEIVELKKLRHYNTGYFFSSDTKDTDPLYLKLHHLHARIGNSLHDVHSYMVANRESDIATFKALLFAYKVWFADVGVERTAKIAENLTNIYTYESNKYRVEGLRKEFPRALLAKRALLYHNARIYHNSGPRKITPLDKILLNDILVSSVSIYPDVSRNAQSSLESSVKALFRSRLYVVNWIVKDVLTSLQDKELLRAESGLRVLALRILQSHIKKNFDNAVNFVKIITLALKADKLTLNELSLSLINIFSQSVTVPVLIDLVNKESLGAIKPAHDVSAKINKLKLRQKTKTESLNKKIVELEHLLLKYLDEKHWKVISVNLTFLLMFMSNTNPTYHCPPEIMIKLNEFSSNSHPGIRFLATNCLYGVFTRTFSLASHEYDIYSALDSQYLLKSEKWIDTSAEGFTESFLKEMRNWDNPSYYIDDARPGYFVWPKQFAASKNSYENIVQLSDEDHACFKEFGKSLNATWLKEFLQTRSEERSHHEDFVSLQAICYFAQVVRMVDMGLTSLTLKEVFEVAEASFDPTDKNSHRCFAEILSALLISMVFSTKEVGKLKLEYATRHFTITIQDHLTRDVLSYWREFIANTLINVDFRRISPIINNLLNFKLDPSSSSMFKETSRLQLLRECMALNWSFQPKPEFIDFLWSNIDYYKKGVCTEIGRAIADLEFCRNHESYASVAVALKENASYGDLGLEVFELRPESEKLIRAAFAKLEKLRLERNNSSEHSSVSPYILAATTLSEWLTDTVSWSSGIGLVKLLPDVIIPALLHFFAISEEVELAKSAVTLFRKLGNLPCPKMYLQSHIETIVKVDSLSITWHQRLAMLAYIQTFFFRQLFLMTSEQRLLFVISASNMLNDLQLEVRETAAETLSGMIRCSPLQEQAKLIKTLYNKFNKSLSTNKFPKVARLRTGALATPNRSGTSTPSSEMHAISIKRHAAVLGLGALVSAFPYKSPPPQWVPQILATLARVASDPGMIGKSVKSLLGDFKNTRNDTWHIDSKAFTTEQLEDLEGVLWKNYFV